MTKDSILKIERIRISLAEIVELEAEKLSNKSDKYQESEQGETYQNNLDFVRVAIDELENVENLS